MKITVEIPDEVFSHSDAAREVLEAVVIEAYRSGPISHSEASRLLGVSRDEFDGLLKKLQIHDHAYSVESLEQDVAVMRDERKNSVAA
jgi:predicted HTH domain antitoxin